jgi:hypothetical protein
VHHNRALACALISAPAGGCRQEVGAHAAGLTLRSLSHAPCLRSALADVAVPELLKKRHGATASLSNQATRPLLQQWLVRSASADGWVRDV